MSPPGWMEGLVAFLLPPACREEILGDLCERCTSPGQYLRDSVRTVPLVIGSRIVRTADPVLMLMEGFALYVSFVVAAREIDPDLLADSWGLLRLAIPGAVTLVLLLFADAYGGPAQPSPLQAMQGPVISILAASLSQAVPPKVMLYGNLLSLGVISILRLAFQPGAPPLQRIHAPAHWRKLELAPLKFQPESMRQFGRWRIAVVLVMVVIVVCVRLLVHR